MTDFDEIYRGVGRKIRQTRENQRLSQDSLAQRLGISRTSMVNIEAGRQRAPLHVLWQIAELLQTKLILLIPSPEELLAPQNTTVLDREMMKQIEEVANGDPATIKVLTGFVTKKLKGKVNSPDTERMAHGKTKSRRKS
jgi:transcriptional regulator with XRE-family HTH domain